MDRDLDLHSLILSSLTSEPPAPVQSADEVIRQIEDIMAVSTSSSAGSVLRINIFAFVHVNIIISYYDSPLPFVYLKSGFNIKMNVHHSAA